MPLATTLKLQINANFSKELDLVTANCNLAYEDKQTLATGTGTGKANQVYHDSAEIAAGDDVELDLKSVLTDAYGDAVVMTKLKAVMVKNTHTTYSLDVGGAAANAVALFADPTDKNTIQADGVYYWSSPLLGLTLGDDDKLLITNDSTEAITYEIVLIGATA